MDEFIAKHRDKITATLSGFDRLVFRGTLRSLSFPDGLNHYLHANNVLLKDFGAHVERMSGLLKEAALKQSGELGRPVQHLSSGQVSKEEIARKIIANDRIREGLVCVSGWWVGAKDLLPMRDKCSVGRRSFAAHPTTRF